MSDTMSAIYWPPLWEEFADRPNFVSHDDGETWTPLCGECGSEMTHRFTPNGSWHCCGIIHLIWAEDWPDFCEGGEECTCEDVEEC